MKLNRTTLVVGLIAIVLLGGICAWLYPTVAPYLGLGSAAGDCTISTVRDRGVESRQMTVAEQYGKTAVCTTPAKDPNNPSDKGFWTFDSDEGVTCYYADSSNPRHPDAATTSFDCSAGKTIADGKTFTTFSDKPNAHVHLIQKP